MLISSIVLMTLLLTQCATTTDKEAKKDNTAKVLQELAGSLVLEGNLREGLAYLLKAVELEPNNPELHHELALVYRDLGSYNLSLQHFKKALILNPKLSTARSNLGTLYLLMREWDLAIESFQMAVNDLLYKTPEIAYNNMGLAYFNKGEIDKAIESYGKALQLSPSYETCYTNLGIAYESQGKMAQAIEAYNNSIRCGSRNPATFLRLARIYNSLNQKNDAAGVLKQFLSIEKDGPNAQVAKELLKQIENP